MELKERLQHYTHAEFVNFIEQIKLVNGSKEEHDKLIRYFDRVVKHPKGADLLFYPESDRDFGGGGEVDFIVYNIKKYHNDNGQLAFKDDSLPQHQQRPAIATPPSTAADRAWKASSAKLVKAQTVIAQINKVILDANNAFITMETLLNAAEAKIPRTLTPDMPSEEQFALLKDELSRLEAAQHAVIRSIKGYDFIKMTIQFARNDAEGSVSRTNLNPQIQASILQQITQSSNQYLTLRPALELRQQQLHPRTEAAINDLEEHLIRVAATIGAGPMWQSIVFSAPADNSATTPRVLTTDPDGYATFELIQDGLKQAIRSAVGGLAWNSTSTTPEKTVRYASVMSFSFDKPGLGEPYAVSVPLSELIPMEGRDWQHLADAESEVDLAFRMGSGVTAPRSGTSSYGLKETTELAHVFVVSTGNTDLASKVKVRAAVWKPESNSYDFVRPGFPARAITWALQYPPNNVDLTRSDRKPTPYHGILSPVAVPLVEVHPCIEDLHFDDCIVVFPENSGIEPVYVMFKGSREHAGAASGAGQVVAGDWLPRDGDPTGAPIPTQIANQLNGKVFKRFSAFSEAFWKTVANASDLSMQFSAEDLATMKEGRAPYSPTGAQPTDAIRLEIRYVITPDKGGNVYDMDNMRIMTRPINPHQNN